MENITITQNVNNIIKYNFDTSINLTGYDCSLYIKKNNVLSVLDSSSFTFTYDSSSLSGSGTVITELTPIDSSLTVGEGWHQHVFFFGPKLYSEGVGKLIVQPSLT